MKIVYAVLIIAATFANPASAGSLKESFKSMFGEDTTSIDVVPAGEYKSLTRTIHTGGYARVRIRTHPGLTPVRFEGPKIVGGCNGFDIYGGAFSYINSEEILSWLRSVAENAASLGTYMFLTFLQEQCSVCSEVMQSLYAFQDLMKTSMSGSCETATAMVSGMSSVITGEGGREWENYKQRIQNSYTNFEGALSDSRDALSAKLDVQDDPRDKLVDMAGSEETALRASIGGNALLYIIRDGDLVTKMKPRLGDTLDEEKLLVYLTKFAGNVIRSVGADGTPSHHKISPDITMSRFIEHDYLNDAVQAVCGGDASCLTPTAVTFKTGYSDLDPFYEEFDCLMAGLGSDCASDGLIFKLGENADLTDDEILFYNNLAPGFPLSGMLNEVSTSQAALESVYTCFRETIAVHFAREMLIYPIEMVLKALDVADIEETLAGEYRSILSRQRASILRDTKALGQKIEDASCKTYSTYEAIKNATVGE